jgi:hypothetical protein
MAPSRFRRNIWPRTTIGPRDKTSADANGPALVYRTREDHLESGISKPTIPYVDAISRKPTVLLWQAYNTSFLTDSSGRICHVNVIYATQHLRTRLPNLSWDMKFRKAKHAVAAMMLAGSFNLSGNGCSSSTTHRALTGVLFWPHNAGILAVTR